MALAKNINFSAILKNQLLLICGYKSEEDYYAVDGAEAEDYDCAGYYEGGYEIELGGFHNVCIVYKTYEFESRTYYAVTILESK